MAKQTFTTGQVLTAAQMTSLQQTAMGGGSTTAKTASYVLVAADAGTVVQMNSASATTITVNNALFAAGDTVQIQNVGAGVCTVTAGTATVSTSATLALKQYDAGSLYFNTTSAAIFFAVDAADGMANVLTTTGDMVYSSSGTTAARLGIGSTGQVITVAGGIPSWATPSSGGLTLLATATPSGASVITFSSIASGYKNLKLVWRGLYVSSTASAYGWSLRLNNDSGANYTYGVTGFSGTAYTENATEIGSTNNYDTFIGSPTTNSTQYNYQAFGSADIYNYADTGPHYVEWKSTSTTPSVRNYYSTGSAVYKDTSAITRLDIIRLNATPTITGTVYLYGVN